MKSNRISLVALSVSLAIFSYTSYDLHLIWPGESVYVRTVEGELKGFKDLSRDGRSFYEFRGIPYAKPPVGELRFEPPVRHPKWNGTRNAWWYGAKCLQFDLFLEMELGHEDCLFLNVYTPQVPESQTQNGKTKRLPIIVFFHGGLFMFGAAGGNGEYRPHYLMDENVILVTVNYRLASFGFLNTGDGIVAGNMGLKDQVMALEWIRDNIHFFGGNPNLVTISGESAGGASVHYHMLSPMSKGLFHRAILMSGTALGHWAFNPKPKEQAIRMGQKLGCPTHSSQILVACLKYLPAATVNQYHEENLRNPILHDPLIIFAPTTEVREEGNSSARVFLAESPLNIVQSVGAVNKVPFINGVNAHEGLIYALGILKDSNAQAQLNKNWNFWAPSLFDYEDLPDEQLKANISAHLRDSYFGDSTLGLQTLYEMVDLFSDSSFFEGSRRTAFLSQNHSMESYMYFNAHRGSFGLGQIYFHRSGFLPHVLDGAYSVVSRWFKNALFGWREKYFGTCHGDEVGLLFRFFFLSNLKKGDSEYSMSKALVKSWVEFAKHGRPLKFKDVDWPAVGVRAGKISHILQIEEQPKIIDEPFSERLKMWDEIRNIVLEAESNQTRRIS